MYVRPPFVLPSPPFLPPAAGGALLDPLVLLSVGALVLSGGTLVALHLLLQPAGTRRQRFGEEEQWDSEEERVNEAIARYDLDKPVEEELVLVLSDEDEEGEGEEDEQEVQQWQEPAAASAAAATAEEGGKLSSEFQPDGRRLSRGARNRRRRKQNLLGPHVQVRVCVGVGSVG
jgi:hypothetical protein